MGYENFSCYYMNPSDVVSPDYKPSEHLKVGFTIFEIIVGAIAVVGNLFVIYIFYSERKLRRRSNYYIISLAIADLMVGAVGIPMSILEAVCLPLNLPQCLLNMYVLSSLLNISVFNILAVSFDRYWAVVHPVSYSTKVTIGITKRIIYVCWVSGIVIGSLPLLWNQGADYAGRCVYIEVVDMTYFAYLSLITVIVPSLILIYIHVQIYRVIIYQYGKFKQCNDVDTAMKIQQKEHEAAKKLSAIVLFFMTCTIPLFFVNFLESLGFVPLATIDPYFIDVTIILSHATAAGNPFLFAFHLTDFRKAVKHLLKRRNYFETADSVTMSSTTKVTKVSN